jgi:hypothetical protein
LAALPDRVRYVGSAEHKRFPSAAGRPRADASKCDPDIKEMDEPTRWLRDGIGRGWFGSLWEGGFPRDVWCRDGDQCYQARLMNKVLGEYKGWPISEQELPAGIDG